MIILSAGGCSRNIPPFGDDISKLADELFPENKPQNLLLITIDTLRADHLGCYGNKSIQTPNIDALADQGILFQQAFTPVPLTLPSHASILTGLYPPAHKIRDNGYFILDDHHQTLAEILKEKGYVTGAVVAAYVLNSRFGLDQGFDFYEDNIVPDPNCEDPFQYERRADRAARSGSGTGRPGPDRTPRRSCARRPRAGRTSSGPGCRPAPSPPTSGRRCRPG